MSDGHAAFCTKCGTRFGGSEVFCTAYGAAREAAAAQDPPPAAPVGWSPAETDRALRGQAGFKGGLDEYMRSVGEGFRRLDDV